MSVLPLSIAVCCPSTLSVTVAPLAPTSLHCVSSPCTLSSTFQRPPTVPLPVAIPVQVLSLAPRSQTHEISRCPSVVCAPLVRPATTIVAVVILPHWLATVIPVCGFSSHIVEIWRVRTVLSERPLPDATHTTLTVRECGCRIRFAQSSSVENTLCMCVCVCVCVNERYQTMSQTHIDTKPVRSPPVAPVLHYSIVPVTARCDCYLSPVDFQIVFPLVSLAHDMTRPL